MQVYPHVYNLTMSGDINSPRHVQWFYFRIRNAVPGVPYQFNIINFEKSDSQFNQGMQPVVFSVADYQSKQIGWRRIGSKISYHKNNISYKKANGTTAHCYTGTFTIEFENADDEYFLAYHYPYSYTCMQSFITRLLSRSGMDEMARRETLTKTLGGNDCDILTITSYRPEDLARFPIRTRSYAFIAARVHPGETNASWIMHGSPYSNIILWIVTSCRIS